MMGNLEVSKGKSEARKRKTVSISVEPKQSLNSAQLTKTIVKKQETTSIISSEHDINDFPLNEKKQMCSTSEDAASQIDDDYKESYEPTLEEIQQVTARATKRQKKKQKHQQRQENQLDLNTNKKQQCDEEYLLKWKNERDTWKFVKRRQISIQQSIFDEQKISEHCWPIALEYLSGSMGSAKDIITKLAEDAIDEMDKQCTTIVDENEKLNIFNSKKYQRARAMLQSFA